MSPDANLTDVRPELRSNRLLAALAQPELAFIAAHLMPRSFRRGEVLFEPGDEVNTTYFPCRGTMGSLLIVSHDGREVEAATIGREGAIGGIVSAGHKPAYGRAVIQIGGTVFVAETARLQEAKQRFPRFSDLFSRYADVLMAQMMQSVACNAWHSIEARCCRWLLATHDRVGPGVITLTQEALAEMLGVRRTTISAVAKALQERGLIRYARGRVEISNRAGIEKAACECYRAVEAHFARVLPEAKI